LGAQPRPVLGRASLEVCRQHSLPSSTTAALLKGYPRLCPNVSSPVSESFISFRQRGNLLRFQSHRIHTHLSVHLGACVRALRISSDDVPSVSIRVDRPFAVLSSFRHNLPRGQDPGSRPPGPIEVEKQYASPHGRFPAPSSYRETLLRLQTRKTVFLGFPVGHACAVDAEPEAKSVSSTVMRYPNEPWKLNPFVLTPPVVLSIGFFHRLCLCSICHGPVRRIPSFQPDEL
jgi:hypothetical protein